MMFSQTLFTDATTYSVAVISAFLMFLILWALGTGNARALWSFLTTAKFGRPQAKPALSPTTEQGYRLSDALDEIEAHAYELGKEHNTPHVDHLRGTLRKRILDIRVGIFETLSDMDSAHQKRSGIECPLIDENAINPLVTVESREPVSGGSDWL